MELLSPHNMGEIRPRHSNEGRPDPRIQLPKGNLHHRSHQNSMHSGKLPTRMYTWVGYLFNESFTSCEENIASYIIFLQTKMCLLISDIISVETILLSTAFNLAAFHQGNCVRRSQGVSDYSCHMYVLWHSSW